MTQLSEPQQFSLPVQRPPRTARDSAGMILGIFAAVAFVGWLLSGFYKVGNGEVAIVERLGQYLPAEHDQQGLHYGLPWPIDRVHKINTQLTNTIDISSFDTSPDQFNTLKQKMMQENPDYPREFWDAIFDPYLITGDKNMLHVRLKMNYHISDAEDYINAIAIPPGTPPDQEDAVRQDAIRQFAEYALTQQVAKMSINDALMIRSPDDNRTPEVAAAQSLQVVLVPTVQGVYTFPDPAAPTKSYSLGIVIDKIDVPAISPPAIVKPAFDGLLAAQAAASVAHDRAQTEAQNAITSATGAVETISQQADGYVTEQVQKATGEADRFGKVYAQFQKDPVTTRFDLYSDCINTILNANNRPYYVMPGQKIVLPIDAPEERIRATPNGSGAPASFNGGPGSTGGS
jgi:membrane protease subunit HflK